MTLVGRLVARRFPAWAELPVTRLGSSGTENAMFRLGQELVVTSRPVRRWAGSTRPRRPRGGSGHWPAGLGARRPLPGNVLVTGGGLSAVIDFGCAGVGDPAVDPIVAWNLLPASVRDVFRDAVGAEDAQWARGRGWALSIALVQLPYYWRTDPVLAQNARHTIGEVLAESA